MQGGEKNKFFIFIFARLRSQANSEQAWRAMPRFFQLLLIIFCFLSFFLLVSLLKDDMK